MLECNNYVVCTVNLSWTVDVVCTVNLSYSDMCEFVNLIYNVMRMLFVLSV